MVPIALACVASLDGPFNGRQQQPPQRGDWGHAGRLALNTADGAMLYAHRGAVTVPPRSGGTPSGGVVSAHALRFTLLIAGGRLTF